VKELDALNFILGWNGARICKIMAHHSLEKKKFVERINSIKAFISGNLAELYISIDELNFFAAQKTHTWFWAYSQFIPKYAQHKVS